MNCGWKYWAMMLSACCALTLGAVDFMPVLERNKADFQKIEGEALRKSLPKSFRWVDSQQSQLRYNRREMKVPLDFGEFPLYEVLISFADNKATELMLSFYNRGDAADMGPTAFKALREKVQAALQEYCGSEIVPGRETVRLEDAYLEAQKWVAPGGDYVLKWNRRGDRAEFLTLSVFPPGSAKTLKESLSTSSDRKLLQVNVERSDDGDAFISVPMVDQGKKGYCVAAVLERILRYYGSEIDQHIIAQIAKSDADIGTNVKGALEVLDDAKIKLKIRIRKLMEEDFWDNFSDFERFNSTYNTEAKRKKRPTTSFNDFVTRSGGKKYLHTQKLVITYEYDIYKAVRLRSKANFREFGKTIVDSVDKGIPLVWVTYVFKSTTPETPIGGIGLHMRIINGYNVATNELIFTDSYGAGHEKKRMLLEDGWAITVFLIQVYPK